MFFFVVSGDPRVLHVLTHSFPTRRASDLRDVIAAALRARVPGMPVISDEDERRAYESDGLTAYRQPPLAVVLPGSTEEVSTVQIGRAHVRTPVTNAHLVCRLLLEKKKHKKKQKREHQHNPH